MEVTFDNLKPHVYEEIILSPHLDDAAFSCSNHIRAQRRKGKQVLVVSVFTAGRSNGEEHTSSLAAPFLNVARRIDEDRQVMQELDVHYLYLNLQEMLFRDEGGCSSRLPLVAEITRVWIKGVLCRDNALQQLLVEHIEQIVEKTECSWLLGPAGVGFHPDHLVVHRACIKVAEKIPRVLMWHYFEFPYCTYGAFLWLRRYELLTRHPMREVNQPAGTAQDLKDRKRLLALYESQIEPCFGNVEALEAAVDSFPDERFLEAWSSAAEQQAASGNGAVALSAPKAAQWPFANCAEIRDADDKTSSPTALLLRVLVFDLILTALALFWCRHGFDWDKYAFSAEKVSFGVIYSSVLRVLCFLFARSPYIRHMGIGVTVICFLALTFVRQLQSLLMALYFCSQLLLGYIEQKFVNTRFPWQRKPRDSGPMNILMVSDYWPPQTHGISTHTFGISTAMREAGHNVNVYTTNRREVDKEDPNLSLNHSLINPWNTDVRLSWSPSLRLIGTMLFADFDLVHLVMPSMIAWPIAFFAWLGGKPVYASAHCHESLGELYMGNTCVFTLMLYWAHFVMNVPLYFFATSFAAPTRSFIPTHLIMRRLYAADEPDRTPIVPSSVDDQRFHPSGRDENRDRWQSKTGIDFDSHCIWLLVCRLAPEKDIPELLKALSLSLRTPREDGRKPVLLIAGDGPLRKELEEQVAREKLPVHFLGFVPNKEVADLFRASDVSITNSVHETFGLTVIESLACGTPMVMPHCAVFDELYGEALGEWMYQKGDVEHLAKAIECASQPAARKRLAAVRRGDSDQVQLSQNLFWSWREAASEQIAQYRGSIKLLEKARVRSILKTLLAVVIITLAFASLLSSS
jgi:glycosyltransferase involved in cell wall biosynthesis/LmbE family N-acetylglucosaminyl deacetylase